MEAVRIPSEAPPGNNYQAIIEYFRGHFAQIGFDTRVEVLPERVVDANIRRYRPEVAGIRSNLVATERSPRKTLAGFYCHLDTVPVGRLDEWNFDPLAPFVRDGYVWGRGTADSKGGATAILWAFQVLQELGIEPTVSPIIVLTTDEEIGPYSGLMYLTDLGTLTGCRWLYSADGLAGSVGYGSPGAVVWTLRIAGRSVHSASSFLGVNPIERAVPLMQALILAKHRIEERATNLPLSPEIAAESGRTYLSGLLNMTHARAGGVQTRVPAEFILEGDRLYTSEEKEDDVIGEIQQIVHDFAANDPLVACSLETHRFYEPFSQDRSHPWLGRVQRLVSLVHDQEVPLACLSGPNDVGYVANRLGIPVAIHGLSRYGESRTHASDERCRVSDLLYVTKVVAGLAAGALDA
jgi:acetylornithine deacetylase/succinyl-diaminopimelate desuccinylase-like protein